MFNVRRMVVAAVVSTAAVLAIVGTGFWFVWMPGYRPALEHGERFGIDVSSHQGSIDWQRVARDGIDFVYIKASEGGDAADARFRANWDGATSAGIEPGAYHFFTLCRSGADQAANFLESVPADRHALAPAVDLEFDGNCSRRPGCVRVPPRAADLRPDRRIVDRTACRALPRRRSSTSAIT